MVQHILIDERLLLDWLFKEAPLSSFAELVWDLINAGTIQGYICDTALHPIWYRTSALNGRDTAHRLVAHLMRQLCICPISADQIRRAQALNAPFDVALQIVCCCDRQLDGILSLNPLDFSRANVDGLMVFKPMQLVVDHLTQILNAQPPSLYGPVQTEPSLGVDMPVLQTSGSPSPGGQLLMTTARLEHIEIVYENYLPEARITLQIPHGEICHEQATGVGPVDATYKALGNALQKFLDLPPYQVIHFESYATTSDSEVAAMILLESGESMFPGRGFHRDIIQASALAYMDAIAYLLQCTPRE